MKSIASRPVVFILVGILRFIGYTLGITAVGAVAGGLAFQIFGRLFVPEMTYAELSLSGLRVGAILAGVWAPGVAIVLCFMWGKKQRDRLRAGERENAP